MLYIANHSIVEVARACKFVRGYMLAKSVKQQRTMLTMAKQCIAKGDVFHARQWIDTWAKERQAFKLANSWQCL